MLRTYFSLRTLRWLGNTQPTSPTSLPSIARLEHGGFTVSPRHMFPETPSNAHCQISPVRSWHVFRWRSQSLERFKRWFVHTPATPGLPPASPRALLGASQGEMRAQRIKRKIVQVARL